MSQNNPIDFGDLDGAFGDADVPEAKGSGEEVPDGVYQAVIEEVYPDTADSGNKLLRWKLRVANPAQHRGAVVWHRNMIMTPENLRWLKKDLATIRQVPSKLAELNDPTWQEAAKGKLVEIKVHTKGDYRNVYVNKLLKTGVAIPTGGGATNAASSEGGAQDESFDFGANAGNGGAAKGGDGVSF